MSREVEEFHIGNWLVEPERNRLCNGTEHRTVRPQVMNLLVYLAHLDGRVAITDALMRDLWPDRIVSQATLYNCVAELRAALSDNSASEYIETIPKKGYRLCAATNLKADSRPSLAVLPFANRSSNSSDAYFVDGMHDEIINLLGNLGDLLVISRTSVLRYRNSSGSIPEIAAELNVSTVLEGSMQRSGDRVRVNVRLIDGIRDVPVWSETYRKDVNADNIFLIQSQIAMELATQLAIVLNPAERRRMRKSVPANLEAYNAVLLGDERFNRNNLEGWQLAESFYRRAIEVDPDYSTAWQRLSKAIVAQLGTFERSNEVMWEALSAADRALELDNQDGLAWLTKGRAELALVRLGEKSVPRSRILQYFEQARSLMPGSAEVVREYGAYLNSTIGDAERGIDALREAAELDPLSASNFITLCRAHRENGQYSQAMSAAERAMELQPDNPYATWETALNHLITGRLSDALTWAMRALEYERDDSTAPYLIAVAAAQIGDLQLAESWYQRGVAMNADISVRIGVRLLLDGISDRHVPDYRLAEQFLTDTAESLLVIPYATDYALEILRDRDLDKGNPEHAEARYLEFAPRHFVEPAFEQEKIRSFIALDLAFLYQNTGKTEQAKQMLESVYDWTCERLRARTDDAQLLWWQMEALLLLGQQESALQIMPMIPGKDWLVHWPWISRRTVLEPVQNSSQFRHLKLQLDKHRQEERQRYELRSSR